MQLAEKYQHDCLINPNKVKDLESLLPFMPTASSLWLRGVIQHQKELASTADSPHAENLGDPQDPESDDVYDYDPHVAYYPQGI